MATVAEILYSGRATFLRLIKPKVNALRCDSCTRAMTVLFSSYWTWMPVSGHISSSAIPEDEKKRLMGTTTPQFSKMGMFCRNCFIELITAWEEAPDHA